MTHRFTCAFLLMLLMACGPAESDYVVEPPTPTISGYVLIKQVSTERYSDLPDVYTRTFQYDSTGKLLFKIVADDLGETDTTVYFYDEQGMLTRSERSKNGDVKTYTFERDQNDSITFKEISKNGERWRTYEKSFEQGLLTRMKEIKHSRGRIEIHNYTYRSDSVIKAGEPPIHTVTYRYDSKSIAEFNSLLALGIFDEVTYSRKTETKGTLNKWHEYDTLHIHNTRPGRNWENLKTYDYDEQGRCIREFFVEGGTDTFQLVWKYDSLGNLLSEMEVDGMLDTFRYTRFVNTYAPVY